MKLGSSQLACSLCGEWTDSCLSFCENCRVKITPCKCCGEIPELYNRVVYEGSQIVYRGHPYLSCASTPPCGLVQKETAQECIDEWNKEQKCNQLHRKRGMLKFEFGTSVDDEG